VALAVAILLAIAAVPMRRALSHLEARRGVAELTQLVALALGFAHLIHGPMSAWLEARHIRGDAVSFASRGAWLKGKVGTDARLGVVRGLAMTMFLPFAIEPHGRPPPAWRLLSHCGHVLVLRRGERALDLVVPRGRSLFPEAELSLYRSPDALFHPGDTVTTPGMKVTIVDADEHGPTRAHFDFDEDPTTTYEWFSDNFETVREAPLPSPGFGAPFDP
jgi:hypothetical protein